MPTAVLVTASAVKVHMRVTATTDDTLIQTIVDPIEELFRVQAGRKDRPYATSATGRTEVKDGTGSSMLALDYPIASLVSIKLGTDVTDPDETLDVSDVDVLVFATGQRFVRRSDGGTFRERGEARVVHVTYNHDADAPDFPKLAIKRAVANVYRQIGAEDSKTESMPDGYSRTLAETCESDPLWQLAVQSQWEPSCV